MLSILALPDYDQKSCRKHARSNGDGPSAEIWGNIAEMTEPTLKDYQRKGSCTKVTPDHHCKNTASLCLGHFRNLWDSFGSSLVSIRNHGKVFLGPSVLGNCGTMLYQFWNIFGIV